MSLKIITDIKDITICAVIAYSGLYVLGYLLNKVFQINEISNVSTKI
jgi:hypothetical protein